MSTQQVTSGPAMDLTSAVLHHDVNALDRLWERTHANIRAAIGRMKAVGRPGSILQATAVVNSVYRLQRERHQRLNRFSNNSDLRYAFGREGLCVEAFRAGSSRPTDEQALRIFSCVVRNEARTYLAWKRKSQRSMQALDSHHLAGGSGADDTVVLLSLFLDFHEAASARGMRADVLQAFELDLLYDLDHDAIARELGVDLSDVNDLLKKARVAFKAYGKLHE